MVWVLLAREGYVADFFLDQEPGTRTVNRQWAERTWMERILRKTRTLGIAICLLTLGACRNQERTEALKPAEPSGPRSAAGAPPTIASRQAEDGQWLMAAKDYANTRFSGLEQINTGNVSRLKV